MILYRNNYYPSPNPFNREKESAAAVKDREEEERREMREENESKKKGRGIWSKAVTQRGGARWRRESKREI